MLVCGFPSHIAFLDDDAEFIARSAKYPHGEFCVLTLPFASQLDCVPRSGAFWIDAARWSALSDSKTVISDRNMDL
jgi:hypothetical protein